MTDRGLTIFLVEDDEVDVMNVRRAFKQHHIVNPLFVASDGIEALEKLRNGEIPKERRIVLLDLNMPRMSGSNSFGKYGKTLTCAPQRSWY